MYNNTGTPYSYLTNQSTTTVNPTYIPPASVKQDGITGTWKGYDIQVVSLQPSDVLLVHISDDMDLDDCRSIMETLKEVFPDNQCVLCNEHILKGISVIRTGKKEKISDTVNITTDINIDKLFDEIMKGNPNDFLY